MATTVKTNHAAASWYSSVCVSPPPSTAALVLAGGKGSRLKASSHEELRRTPKVLVPIKGADGAVPMLGHALDGLADAGIRRVAVLTSEDPDAGGAAIEQYVLGRFMRTFDLALFRESRPLGTAGAVFAALRQFEAAAAVVVPADTLFPFSLIPAAISAHMTADTPVTWVLTTEPGDHAQNAGRVLIDPSTSRVVHALEGVEEDPPAHLLHTLRPATSTGVVVVRPAAFCDLFAQFAERQAQPCPADLYRHFIPWLISRGVPSGAFDIQKQSPDLGTAERLFAFGR